MNKQGKAYIKGLCNNSQLKENVTFDTFRVTDQKGGFKFRCLDSVATININDAIMDHAWIEWTDHALIIMEVSGLTAIKPEYAFDRRDIEETCKDPLFLSSLLNSTFPFTSAEEAVALRVQKQP